MSNFRLPALHAYVVCSNWLEIVSKNWVSVVATQLFWARELVNSLSRMWWRMREWLWVSQKKLVTVCFKNVKKNAVMTVSFSNFRLPALHASVLCSIWQPINFWVKEWVNNLFQKCEAREFIDMCFYWCRPEAAVQGCPQPHSLLAHNLWELKVYLNGQASFNSARHLIIESSFRCALLLAKFYQSLKVECTLYRMPILSLYVNLM